MSNIQDSYQTVGSYLTDALDAWEGANPDEAKVTWHPEDALYQIDMWLKAYLLGRSAQINAQHPR